MSTDISYLINHIFLPPKLPQKSDLSASREHALCTFVQQCANRFTALLSPPQKLIWGRSFRFLGHLCRLYKSEILSASTLQETLGRLAVGDILALPVRAQNAAVKICKGKSSTIIELFEVSLPAQTVLGATGKVVCTFPGPAFTLSNSDFESASFQEELASFLAQMDVDILEAAQAKTRKAGSVSNEYRETADPRFITDLLAAILAGFSTPADVKRIQKRIGDDVLWDNALLPWRRSPMWLVIRVTLQTALFGGNSHADYKSFMLFCMTQLLQDACDVDLKSDLLHFMRSKLSHRFFKLDGAFSPSSPSAALHSFQSTLRVCEDLLQRRWADIREQQAQSPVWNPQSFDIQRDTQLDLPHSRQYLIERIDTNASIKHVKTFAPQCTERLSSIDEALNPKLFQGVLSRDSTPELALMDFETCVIKSIDDWVRRSLPSGSSCSNLAKVIEIYASTAQVAYRSNHEQLSIMLLTIFELWAALDKIAVHQCPLMRDYLPEVSVDLLTPLVLSKESLMVRVSKIETYIRERVARASYGSVFDDASHKGSFACRLYSSSSELRALEAQIQSDAAAARQAKVAELNKMKKTHSDLLRQEASLSHKEVEIKGRWTHKEKRCPKCRHKKLAAKMRIEIFEAPLPEEQYKRQTVVFELCCPQAFGIWRSTTYYILFDICRRGRVVGAAQTPIYTLKEYRGLQAYVKRGFFTRVSLASHEKSFYTTHYQWQHFPASEQEVLRPNGLKFRLFDETHKRWATNSFTECNVSTFCTPLLSSKFSSMQYAVDSTNHTPNEVLANQSECPVEWNVHEYIAFCSLRSGGRTQWLNVLRMLAAQELSFRLPEVEILVSQAAYQIGPTTNGSIARDWHIDLDRQEFRLQLLLELDTLLDSVKQNWLNVPALRIVIALTLRVLHHTVCDPLTQRRCDDILRASRVVAYSWLSQLLHKLESAIEDDHISNSQSLICEMAITCRLTYDVDSKHVARLFSTDDDISLFVQCAVRIADHTPSDKSVISPLLTRLLARNMRISHSTEAFLVTHLQERCAAIDNAICAIWGEYSTSLPNGWSSLPSPHARWIKAHPDDQNLKCIVHFNILDGTLLINGARLGRLPPEIVQHPTYKRIFGSRILNVVPSSIDGMQYSTLSEMHGDAPGFYAYFLLERDQLFIQARARTGTYYFELIPHTVFEKDFPVPFSDEYTHWLELPAGISYPTFYIEFRPREQPWKSSSRNWRLGFNRSGHSILRKSSTKLINQTSVTFSAISRRLRPLEAPSFIIVSEVKGRVFVELPRYRLSFFLNTSGQLQSYTHPGFIVDENQSAGVFFGLRNQMVLRSADSKSSVPTKRILVPVGAIGFAHEAGHTQVTVNTSGEAFVRYHVYEVDTTLGRLVGDGTLYGKFYQVLLHALTSYCLADPLTSRTGVGEALELLGSASCASFQSLTTKELELLRLISSLTPPRVYYPAHLTVMQRVAWQKLPIFVQHYSFAALCEGIVDFAKDVAAFDPPTQATPELEGILTPIGHLEHRAALRSRIMYPPETRHCTWSSVQDVIYLGDRHTGKSEPSCLKAIVQISRAAHDWKTALPTMSNLWETLCQWSSVAGADKRMKLHTFRYSRETFSTDLPATWLTLYNWSRQEVTHKTRFMFCFTLGALLFSSSQVTHQLSVAATLLSFATNSQFRHLTPPVHSAYRLGDGIQPSQATLEQLVKGAALSLLSSPSGSLQKLDSESWMQFEARRDKDHAQSVKEGIKQIAQELLRQWKAGGRPSPPLGTYAHWFDATSLVASVGVYFCSCRANVELRRHVTQVQTILDSAFLPLPDAMFSWATVRPKTGTEGPEGVPSLQTLFLKRLSPSASSVDTSLRATPTAHTDSQRKLASLIDSLRERNGRLYGRYAQALEDSFESFFSSSHPTERNTTPTETQLESFPALLRQRFDAMERRVCEALSPQSEKEHALFRTGNWPCLSLRALLSTLASTSLVQLTAQWRKAMIDLGLALLFLQRAQRLLHLASTKNLDHLKKEASFASFDEETALQNPDWLLIQLESDFMIRPIQSRVASEMICPSSLPVHGHNTVLQLNMGEGKSSVIIPVVATTLADGERLVRVVVLKPLGRQMRQLLTDRLGGLVNRRVFYFPFSRDISLDVPVIQKMKRLYSLCVQKKGVLVIHPEHILSFKLATIDRLLSGAAPETAQSLFETQKWLDAHTRDILDESDEILHVQYQLVYTSGQQNLVEDNPYRWVTISQVLYLAAVHAKKAIMNHPDAFEYHSDDEASFPRIRILDADAAQRLVQAVASDLVGGDDFRSLPLRIREAALTFITTSTTTLDSHKIQLVHSRCRGTNVWSRLLLLRGLLGYGLLLHTLMERRWRVNFGLLQGEDTLKRTRLAVPYVAKDIPSQRADFGHPDVALVLTYLSYYYQGLDSQQLFHCFGLILKQDNAAVEYEKWIADMTRLPGHLRSLANINMENEQQWEDELVPWFRHNRQVINFYLSDIVFPKEAKQFTHKLSTSAWDLAALKTHPTTGFSGTNDSQFLLPTSISQVDPVGQLETNAKVLSIVLQPENNHFLCVQDEHRQPLSSADFLRVLVQQSPPIHILLDVGAQMLDMQNAELAAHWLSLIHDAEIEAAIFFNDHDDLVVHTRGGSLELLATSPFKKQLGKCLIYLDDAHTRGTDLKIPRGARAAVTLGPKVTKDRLLQGCMRMRMLGDGHSVMFFAPPEVAHSISSLMPSPSAQSPIHAQDILRWAMTNTCEQVIHYGPRWAIQGVDYEQRERAWKNYQGGGKKARASLKSAWLQPDTRTLEEMYGPKPAGHASATASTQLPEAIYQRCLDLDVVGIDEHKLDEEQQREVTAELEIQPQIERPPKATAEHHTLIPEVKGFIHNSRYTTGSSGFLPLAAVIEACIPGFKTHTNAWSKGLVATQDFARTVRKPGCSDGDALYLRPVNWIVSGGSRVEVGGVGTQVLVILSQYEVNQLLPVIRQHKKLRLHMYSPRLTQGMRIFDDLAYHCIPPLPLTPAPSLSVPTHISPQHILELNIFAGRLYFPTYDAYLRFCEFFGVMSNETDDSVDCEIDGWVVPENRVGDMTRSPFTTNPLPLLKTLMSVRRKGMGYDSTHVGRVLRARRLMREDIETSANRSSPASAVLR
ncbi:hypothetical protein BOTBODRAFT_36481 [Botryobasidium botryosum FD-172 SS1]|uniref:ubiquitinyl hydrolase 1 n=1 Tax=Botryobasidium botryosum (strain FD-172 SS1) TaxID=930990 RepID=A0A067ME82_BOTB1|nr:hypothetical protein BOTBODRAFT_36481 [Botryobasidium botryosum FD-172 SS1]